MLETSSDANELLIAMDFARSQESAEYILKRTKARPILGIICGSGLGKLLRTVEV